MKSSYSRRYRRSHSTSRESAVAKKDNHHEHTFFCGPSQLSFFQPTAAIQRKCDQCEAEDKKAQRSAEPKAEEKKLQKMSDKKEEDKIVHRQAEPKEDEKKIHKMEDKKEEMHRAAGDKEEEKKLHKMEEKKEDKEVHRQGDKKEEEKNVAKKESSTAGNVAKTTGAYIQSLSGKGHALPDNAQQFFGARIGHDFSNVKIHTGTEAEESANEINAKAYTVDKNIVFNKGQYDPSSADGKKLLAHELTHVVQQDNSKDEVQLAPKGGVAKVRYSPLEVKGHKLSEDRLDKVRRGEVAAKTRLKLNIVGQLQKVSDAIASFETYAQAASDTVAYLTSSLDELKKSIFDAILDLGGIIVPEGAELFSILSNALSIMNASALTSEADENQSFDKRIKGFLRNLDEVTRTNFAAATNDLQKNIDTEDLVMKFLDPIDPERTYKIFERASENDIKTITKWAGIPDPAEFSLFYQVYEGLLEQFNVWLEKAVLDYYRSQLGTETDDIIDIVGGESVWTKDKRIAVDNARKQSKKDAITKATDRHEPNVPKE